MAGGPNAEAVVCMVCLGDGPKLTKATRIYEGDEDDRYRCELGHEFGLDWARGKPTEPQWPPGPEYADLVTS
ncbi:MAG: hypothetical protein ABI867_22045 [Kofleriaceae bacterium]